MINRKTLISVAAIAAIAASVAIGGAAVSNVELQRGQSVTVTCPIRPSVSKSGTSVIVSCPGPAPTATPIITPAPSPAPSPTPNPTPSPTIAPTPSPTAPTAIRIVSSIIDLKKYLADNTIDEIIVTDGTYHISTAASQNTDSLWVGAAFASRTRPILVRAQTPGGVTFDGGGASYFGGITFVAGAHDQTWDGFIFANGTPTQTGVIVFGGYAGLIAPHHITLRNITLTSSIRTNSTGANDHGVYFSLAVGGPHDITIENLVVNGSGGLDSAIHAYHSDTNNINAYNVVIRGLQVTGTDQAIMLYDSTLKNWLIENSTITNATSFAVRYEHPGTGILLRNIVSTGSGSRGFYSSLGLNPPGITFQNCELN